MPALRAVWLCLVLVACGRVSFAPVDASTDARPTVDGASADADASDAAEDGSVDANVDGGSDATPDAAADGGVLGHNVIFVTPPMRGSFGGVAGADALCASLAEEAGLGGTFVALLSTSTTPARDRLGAAEGWVRPDGRVFVERQADLWAGPSYYPPMLDHMGRELEAATDFRVWTGTDRDGAGPVPETCDDWTSDAARGGIGRADSVPDVLFSWIGGVNTSCSAFASIYCLQIDHTTPPEFVPRVGRRIFIADWASGTPEEACTVEAADNGFPGTYHALVARAGTSALSGVTLDRWPWVRPDGVTVLTSEADLFDGVAQAPVLLYGDRTINPYRVLTGATSPDASAMLNCSEWMSFEMTDLVNAGSPTEASHWFYRPPGASGEWSCSLLRSVYCLEE